MRPAFRRGWEGEEKPKSMPWRGPAGAQRPPHGGVYFGLGNERAKPLVFRSSQGTAPIRRFRRREADHQKRHPRTARRRRMMCRYAECATRPLRVSAAPPSKRARARRSSGKERGESAWGSALKRRALRSAKRGTERAHKPSRSSSSTLPIVTRMGRDYRPGARQRIERVARRAASSRQSSLKKLFPEIPARSKKAWFRARASPKRASHPTNSIVPRKPSRGWYMRPRPSAVLCQE